MRRSLVVLILSLLLATVAEAAGAISPEELLALFEESGFSAPVPLPEKYRPPNKVLDTCPIFVPEDEVWEVYYSVTTNVSTDWDECTRLGWWSGWHELDGPGAYDIQDLLPNANFDPVIFIIWIIRPLYSCEWLAGPAVGGDCTRETHEAQGWTTPQWYVVCPGWDAAPLYYTEACLLDDGFESGGVEMWDAATGVSDPGIFEDGFETGDTSRWSGEVP
jgi:hypothetical protein